MVGRSIPACAGEPSETRERMSWLGVYPRVCGGTPPTGLTYGPIIGLSPRVRGNP